MKKKIQISVTELVMAVGLEGDINSDAITIDDQAGPEGVRIHKKIQSDKPENYQKEVTISHTFEFDTYLIEISGRIDGIYEENQQLILEEIKTGEKSFHQLANTTKNRYWFQLKIYACLYTLKKDLPELIGQLTYYNRNDQQITYEQKKLSQNELIVFYNTRIKPFLMFMEKAALVKAERYEKLSTMDFPFNQIRPGQQELIERVSETILAEAPLFCQAATGTGKTMAVLFPAVQALASGLLEKIFFLTARSTGKAIGQDALKILSQKGSVVQFVTLTAREKACLNDILACNGEDCIYARGFYDRLSQALEVVLEENFYTPEKIRELSIRYALCPFEYSLALSLFCDVIFCDYNYVFDPRVYLRRFFWEKKINAAFLIDEAHNLVDRSREMFSAQLNKKTVLKIRREYKNQFPDIYKKLGKLNQIFIELKKKQDLIKEDFDKEFRKEIDSVVNYCISAVEQGLDQAMKKSQLKELINFYFELTWFRRILQDYNEHYVI
ncbi:MAG: PD-(D/E)XK nuclease family protein, partial [Spirochaetes bacterium]|nr:PD-(D/E)XK nuclease family protein [Spirochaetota bacterium]